MAVATRWMVFAVSLVPTVIFACLLVSIDRADGWTASDSARLILSTLCIFWLSWGAASGLTGFFYRRPEVSSLGLFPKLWDDRRTAILMPIYNEDPASTFARIAAMSARLHAIGAHSAFDIFILSDSTSLEAAANEAVWFDRLLHDCVCRDQIFYRRRLKNLGRKAGNIEEFVSRSGGAYEYAVVLDADSLMDAETLLEMVGRMEEAPRLALLQTLPVILNARSAFGRAIQFAAHTYTPVFARGLALLQGPEGPYWGHNAIFRVTAFAQCCGLPALSGKPPFGGHILSHDYVEGALLARRGWQVRLDPDLGGSFEEGPDNLVAFAKRDQRWCQGNLQHLRVVSAPRLKLWSRITLVQGIAAYLMPLVWLLLLFVSFTAAALARGRGVATLNVADWTLIGLVGGLLILPKLAIAVRAIVRGVATTPVDALRIVLATLLEIVLSSITAPVSLLFQVRAVSRVVLGFDGGWPASNRADGSIGWREAWASSSWITLAGALVLAAVFWLAPSQLGWILPIALPLVLAPAIITLTSRSSRLFDWLWTVPTEAITPPVVAEYEAILHRWTAEPSPTYDIRGLSEEPVNAIG